MRRPGRGLRGRLQDEISAAYSGEQSYENSGRAPDARGHRRRPYRYKLPDNVNPDLRLMIEAGATLTAIADRLDVDVRVVRRWAGGTQPRKAQRERLAAIVAQARARTRDEGDT